MGGTTPGVEVWAWHGVPPSDDAIRAQFGLTGAYTYVVATTAQEDLRKALATPAQADEHSPLGVALVFHKAVRMLMGGHPISRTEERVLASRAIPSVAASDDERQRLAHDASTWAEVLADLDGRGVDLTDAAVAAAHAPLWVDPKVGELLAALQQARRDPVVTGHTGPADGFESLARQWLLDRPALGHTVVLDGFTRLTDLQRLMIETAAEHARVVLLFPYEADDEHAAIKATYAPWWGTGPKLLATAPLVPAAIETLVFDHRHQEATACILRIKDLLASGVEAGDIAVVTPFRRDYDSVLQEAAELEGLSVRIGVPPRLLLLTPLGRFVLTLYQIWGGTDVHMDADQFEQMLGSGWLGAATQTSAAEFRLVKRQLFSRLRTGEEWAIALDGLAPSVPAPRPDSRIPADWLDPADVQRWREAVEQLRRITASLFDDEERPIGGHVRQLLEELKALPDVERFEAEKELLERLGKALEEAADATSIDLTSEEFGDVLVALAKEREEAARTEEESLADTDRQHIWVTTPEGIDGVVRDHVLFVGVTDEAVPRPYREPWPYARDERDEHIERERYQFHAVTVAARRHLTVSYARHTMRGRVGPSPFLLRLGDPISPEAPEPIEAPNATPSPLVAARRDKYALAELAHYAVCPYRYKIERLDARSRLYESDFHLKLLAESHWVDLILTWAAGQPGPERGQRLLERLRAGRDATADEARAHFPGLRQLIWNEVAEHVDRVLQWVVYEIQNYEAEIVPAGSARYDLVINNLAVTVEAPTHHATLRGKFKFRYAVLADVTLSEWPYPPAKDGQDEAELEAFEDAVGFPTRRAAFIWWRRAAAAAAKAAGLGLGKGIPENEARLREEHDSFKPSLVTIIEHMEAGSFPKRPGDHCKYCPARNDCLGLEP